MNFSDWKPGNWCWLPPLPPGSGDSSRLSVMLKSEGNKNADQWNTSCEAAEGVPDVHSSLSSSSSSLEPRTKTEPTKTKEEGDFPQGANTNKHTKKEEEEEDTHRDQSILPAEAVKSENGSVEPRCTVKRECKHEHKRPKQEDPASAAGDGGRGGDYSGWTAGSWCWLPPTSPDEAATAAAAVPSRQHRCKTEWASARPKTEEDPNDSGWRAGSWCWLPDEAVAPASEAPPLAFPAGASRKRARDNNCDCDYDDQEFDSDLRPDPDSSPPTETMTRQERARASPRCSSRIGRAKRDPDHDDKSDDECHYDFEEDDESAGDESSKFEFELEEDDECTDGFDNDDEDDGFYEIDDDYDDDDNPSIRDDASEFSEVDIEGGRNGEGLSVDNDAEADGATSTYVPRVSEEPNGEKSKYYDALWDEKFQLLVKYKKQHGTTKVPKTDRILGHWTRYQRVLKRVGRFSEKRFARLQSIGFEWNPNSSSWETMYTRLVEYKNKYKNTNVSTRYKKDPRLGKWVKSQRSQCKRKERIDRLNRIGFVWNRSEEIENRWDVMYQQLVKYKQKHNSTSVPAKYKPYPKLGRWVQSQRKYCRRKDRVQRLNDIGFRWAACSPCPYNDERWEKMYQRFVKYKKKHNTTCVSVQCKEDPKLGNWVHAQRQRCRRKDRVQRLNDIGFIWNRTTEIENQWDMMYQRLVEYNKKHNTTCVPNQYKEDPKLGNWVSTQRQECSRKDRVQRLNGIGFIWNTRVELDNQWDVMYQRLVEYNKKHNTTCVPNQYKPDPKLGKWVITQRLRCHKKDRINRLDAIGFVWDCRNQWN